MKSAATLLAVWCLTAATAMAAETDGALTLRRMTDRGTAPDEGGPIPAAAVRVFAYEGTPKDVRVTGRFIAVDYGRSGVLFARPSGQIAQRYTLADGWPGRKPEEFTSPRGWQRPPMVGPGVVNVHRTTPVARPDESAAPLPDEVAAEVQLAGQMWRAYQPPQFVPRIKRPEYLAGQPRPANPTWSEVLAQLNEASYVEVDPGGGAPPKRFTMADGLASNIVTDLVVCGDSLWAACVDIYDPETQQWGPGGLCRYDAKTGRWERIERIDGRPVRWVTLLRTIGDELWVGFREGKGVAGDEIAFGMGVYPGIYRPEASAIVLARWADGRWTSFSRAPLREAGDRYTPPEPEAAATPPTEHPVALGRLGDKVLLFTRTDAHQVSGNFDLPMSGHVSLIDLASGKWRLFDPLKELDADELKDMIVEGGEVLVTSNRGLHRFDPAADRWQRLDSGSPIRNATFHTAAVVDNELWLGYARQSFGVYGEQGISRYDETTGRWSQMTPEQLGTAGPVRRIVAMPGGDVWVLFGDRPYMGAAVRYDFYPREQVPRPEGLGRLAGGKWEFPLSRPPAPERPPIMEGVRDDIAAVGDRLVFATPNAVWVTPDLWRDVLVRGAGGVQHGVERQSPEPWRALLQGEDIVRFEPVEGQDAVEIICRRPKANDNNEEKPEYRRWLYHMVAGNPQLDETEMTNEAMNSVDLYYAMMGPSIVESDQPTFTLPGVPGQWAFVYSGGGYFGRGVLVSPSAVWIFNPGEVIRVDRKAVEAVAGAGRGSASAKWRIGKRKQDDTVEVQADGDTAVCSIRSPSGIGGAEITPQGTTWPKNVVVRLYLRGLEGLDISVGDPSVGGVRLHAEVQSHSGYARLLEFAQAAEQPKPVEKDSLYWCEINAFNVGGKPIAGLPEAGGYFEIALPPALGLLESKTAPLKINWIDFYRG